MRSGRWTRAGSLVLAVLAAAGVAAAASMEDPVALLVKFQGDVTVQPADSTVEAMAGAVGMPLLPGDRVVVAEGGQAVVLYRDGQLVKAAATVTIEASEQSEPSSLFTSTVRTLGQVAGPSRTGRG